MNTLQNVYNQVAGYLRSIGGNPWGTLHQRGWSFNGPNGEKCALQGICKARVTSVYDVLREVGLPAIENNIHFCDTVMIMFDQAVLTEHSLEDWLLYIAHQYQLSYFSTIPEKKTETKTEKEVETV